MPVGIFMVLNGNCIWKLVPKYRGFFYQNVAAGNSSFLLLFFWSLISSLNFAVHLSWKICDCIFALKDDETFSYDFLARVSVYRSFYYFCESYPRVNLNYFSAYNLHKILSKPNNISDKFNDSKIFSEWLYLHTTIYH